MFCPKCGKRISDDSDYCPFCGSEIFEEERPTRPEVDQYYNDPPYDEVTEEEYEQEYDEYGNPVPYEEEEFRPGAVRKLSDDEVKEKLDGIFAKFERTKAGIEEYRASL